jgi:RNA polymerase sigma-70 factor (ECF subfamily)
MHAAVMPMSRLAAESGTSGMSGITIDRTVEAVGHSRPSIDLNDEQALRAAVREHGAELYRFARRVLGDSGLAEEAVQETFLKAWRRAQRFDPARASLRTWLFAILRNTTVDLARARSTRPALSAESNEDDAADPIDAIEGRMRSWQVEEALRQLSDDHRTAVVEVHLRARSYEEVGQDLGIPAGTVKSRVYYGLKALKSTLIEQGWIEDE